MIAARVVASPTREFATNNLIVIHPGTLADASHATVRHNGINHVFSIGRSADGIDSTHVALSAVHRKHLHVALNDTVQIGACDSVPYIDALAIDVIIYNNKGNSIMQFDTDAAALAIVAQQHILQRGRPFLLFNTDQVLFICTATNVNNDGGAANYGIPSIQTKFVFNTNQSTVELKGSLVGDQRTIFATGWTFDQFGVGGLDEQFKEAFRRAFLSRILPPDVIDKLGVIHVKGMIM